MRHLPWAVSATLFLTACATTPYTPPAVEPEDAQFPGLLDLLANTPGKALDVYIVHGMCTHNQDWVTSTFTTLGEQLGALTTPATLKPARIKDTAIETYTRTFTTSQGEIHAHALVWSPLTTPLKQQLCYDQTNKSAICTGEKPYRPKRAWLNALAKDTLLNDCIADALIYQGQSRLGIVREMQTALTSVAASSAGIQPAAATTYSALARAAVANRTPLVIITESLGSKIVYDAIYNMQTAPRDPAHPGLREVGVSLIDRSRQIFMLANQIPLLGLADQSTQKTLQKTSSTEVTFPPDPLAVLLTQRKDRRAMAQSPVPPPAVVAFTDPNDVLSYVLTPSAYDRASTTDVWVSNATTWFGAFENPWTAHKAYAAEQPVMEKIVCGYPKSTRCP